MATLEKSEHEPTLLATRTSPSHMGTQQDRAYQRPAAHSHTSYGRVTLRLWHQPRRLGPWPSTTYLVSQGSSMSPEPSGVFILELLKIARHGCLLSLHSHDPRSPTLRQPSFFRAHDVRGLQEARPTRKARHAAPPLRRSAGGGSGQREGAGTKPGSLQPWTTTTTTMTVHRTTTMHRPTTTWPVGHRGEVAAQSQDQRQRRAREIQGSARRQRVLAGQGHRLQRHLRPSSASQHSEC